MKLVQNRHSLLDSLTIAILKSRQQAILLMMLFSFVPFLSFLAMIGIAIITLRQGAKEGAIVFMVVLLPLLSVAAYQGNTLLGVENAVISLGVIWLFAYVLRNTCSWSAVSMTAVLLSVFIGIMISILYPNHVDESREILSNLLSKLQKSGQVEYDVTLIKSNIDWFASYLFGVQIAMTTLIVLSNLACARYMQSRIYNPGGFSKEFLNLRLSYVNALIFAGALLGLILDVSVVKTFIIVSAMPLIIAGISLMHWRVRRLSKGRLMILLPSYCLLIAFPFSFVFLMTLGFVDMWFDFRNFQFQS